MRDFLCVDMVGAAGSIPAPPTSTFKGLADRHQISSRRGTAPGQHRQPDDAPRPPGRGRRQLTAVEVPQVLDISIQVRVDKPVTSFQARFAISFRFPPARVRTTHREPASAIRGFVSIHTRAHAGDRRRASRCAQLERFDPHPRACGRPAVIPFGVAVARFRSTPARVRATSDRR